ncbi:serine hydrolase domain-containing protein [uncultured Psychroserpens sp.]|uniref:serine hydrolase domain-containing protein n=1 Tax=uncultured Psychroserpens sp. TaxID=255436 RepID=UPI00261E6949|nr:serine hydrolase domain-containing protein [uncultured Psychroserpens sp.]
MNRLQKITTLFVLLGYSLYSQDNQPQFIKDSLESYIKTEQKLWQIPAVAVAIIKDGKIVKTIVNGVKDIESNAPLDENSLFMIGSNSKAFTSILMATLAEEKLFSLKDPVKKWLPYFKLKDPWLTEKVNVLDILSHRVGFETFQGDFLNFDNELSSEDIIKKFALIEPTYDYRETWGYFNTGYTIAGEIIKASSNKTWAEQLRTKIFIPLEMNNSLALSEEIKSATNTTLAHTIVDGKLKIIPYGDIDATAPAGSISSSITDMSKWVIALLNNGTYNGAQVIPKRAIDQTIYPRSIQGNSWHPFNKSHFSLYGLGWDLQDYEGHKLIMHTGGIHGYVTSVTTVPEKNIGIVILTNTDQNYFFEALKWDILDAYLDLPRNNYSQLYRSFYERGKEREKTEKDLRLKEVAENNKPSVSLDRFEGSYKNEVYGMLSIKKVGEDELRIDFEHHKDLKVKLMHLKNNEFYAVFNNPLYGESVFPFVIENNNVVKFTLKLHPSVERTTYDFYKE